MSLSLFRIDERLLHGQVIVGWGMRLGIDYYVVVDDALADSEWEQDLYSAGLPGDTGAEFVSVEQAVARFSELDGRAGRGALLTPGTGEMRSLAEAGLLTDRRINLGGLHAGENRIRVHTYIHLAPGEAADLKVIAQASRGVTARDLPAGKEIALENLIDDVE
ncbi:MAG: PTS sugar transporter subunit IIB [marine benthic group bacterium]|jgi:PTS system mannose-specific IIB component/fructoselysine and glucoselysine-specific PTS system IIB component|nr:PTS sugar transporter subunit IIB [Candidatus Benthicola marisminoris]